MTPRTYRIRKALLVPFGADAVLLIALLFISIFWKGTTTEIFVLVILLVPCLYFFLEALYRTVTISDGGILIQKLLRKKDLLWEDITHVGHLVVRKKVYILLTTVKGFHIVSNAYENFSGLVKDICDHVEKDKVEEQLAGQIKNPIRDISNIIATWFAALVILGIIITKFYPLY
ncbi:MAG: hypothetical protein JXA41_03250 [Deltaproteobacteria bacterium]|nr:hypothetical protein [Deltaproteobacteria bacterium]